LGKVANKITGCFSVAKLTLKVSIKILPQTYSFIAVPVCDDTLASSKWDTTADPTTKEMEYQLLI
jgi:hypothetical protein